MGYRVELRLKKIHPWVEGIPYLSRRIPPPNLFIACVLSLLVFSQIALSQTSSQSQFTLESDKPDYAINEEVYLFISGPASTRFEVKITVGSAVSERGGVTSSKGNAYLRFGGFSEPGEYRAKLYENGRLKHTTLFSVKPVEYCPSCVAATSTTTTTSTTTVYYTSTPTTSTIPYPAIASTTSLMVPDATLQEYVPPATWQSRETGIEEYKTFTFNLTPVDAFGTNLTSSNFRINDGFSFVVNLGPVQKKAPAYNTTLQPPQAKRILSGSGFELISAVVFDSDNNPAPFSFEVEENENGFVFNNPPARGAKPGIYRLVVELSDGVDVYSGEMEFSLGLVSLNTVESIYKPGETAELIIVVLDREGRPVCGAEVNAAVVDPLGAATVYSTGDGSVWSGSGCGLYNAWYPARLEGNHSVYINAVVDGTVVDFSTFFLVQKDFDFDVSRNAESKIDPTVNDKFNVWVDVESFVGADSVIVKETVPSVFDVESDASVQEAGEVKVLTWERQLSEGKTSVSYSYGVPDVWPYLYQLGPIKIQYANGSFTEARPWYVAVDPTYGGEASGGLRPQSMTCYARGGSVSCDGSYPTSCPSSGGSDYLSCNDGSEESHATDSAGFAGLEGPYYNTSINNCLSITYVAVCYEWRSSRSDPNSCVIAVDADGGSSYSTVYSTCPGTAGASGCIPVTSAETWLCENFFGSSGTRAYMRSRQASSNSRDTTAYWDQLWFNVTYSIDQPPNTTWGSPPAAAWYARSATAVTINCSASDDLSVSNVTFQQDSDGVGTYTDVYTDTDHSDGQWNWTYNPSDNTGPCSSASIGSTGTCYLGCFATDSKSQSDASPATSNIRIDGEPPTGYAAGIQGKSEGTWISGSSFTVQCTGAVDPNSGSGVSTYDFEYTTDNACSSGWTSISGCTGIAGDCSWPSPPSSEDDFCVRCRATDAVGNDGNWDEASYLGIDNSPPTCSMTSPQSYENITSSPHTMTADESDGAGSGMASVTYYYNNGTGWYAACTSSSAPFDCDFSPPANLEDWTNVSVIANCTDNSGLSNTSSPHSDITVDVVDQAPVADLASLGSHVSATESLDASASAEPDPTDEIYTYVFNISSDAAFTSPYTVCSGASYSCSWDTTSPPSTAECPDQSTCYVRVWVNDTRSSADASDYQTVFVDNSGPNTTVGEPQNNTYITSESTLINASADDGSGIGVDCVEFSFNNGSWHTLSVVCSPPYDHSWDLSGIPDQANLQVRARANDSFGFVGGFDVHGNITHDTHAPYVTLSAPQPAETITSSPYTLNASSTTDAIAGVANCTWYYSLAGLGSWNLIGSDTDQADGLTFSWNLPADDTYDVNATCADKGGLFSSNVSANVVVDAGDSPPVCTIGYPNGNLNLSGIVIVNATASEPDAADVVENVTFNYSTDGGSTWNLIGINTTADLSAYSIAWDTSGIDGTSVLVRCLATDSRDSTGMDDSDANFTVDNTAPTVSGEAVNDTLIGINEYVCLNATVTDNIVGVDSVWAVIDRPDPALDEEVSLLDDGSGCDSLGGDDVYSAAYQNTYDGSYNWTRAEANDSVGNLQTTYPSLVWNVSSAASMTTNMTHPLVNTTVNESGPYNWFWVNCTASCNAGGNDCQNVYLDAEYYDGGWLDMNSTTPLKISAKHSCGTLTAGGPSCSAIFNVSADPAFAGSTYKIRCMASSTNAGQSGSGEESNASINDQPLADWGYPAPGAYVSGVVNLNASGSSDALDGVVFAEFWEDSDSGYDSTVLVCNDTSSAGGWTCSWNTTSDVECAGDGTCYLRVTVADAFGLTNSSDISVEVDNSGPTSILDRPDYLLNLSASSYTVNASVSDSGVGTISSVLFDYRFNSSEPWLPACNDSDGTPPYQCTWNTSTLSEGLYYTFRVSANDSLGNLGGADSHANITLDRTAPNASLASPENNDYVTSTNASLTFTVQDNLANPIQCSLYMGGTFNQTVQASNSSAAQANVSGLPEGSHAWYVNCSDAAGNFNVSGTWNFIIDVTPPAVNLVYPPNAAWLSQSTFDFNYTPSDVNGVDICILYANFSGGWSVNGTEEDPLNGSVSGFSRTLSDGVYIWNVWCNDSAGLSAFNSTNYTVSVDTLFPTIGYNPSTLPNQTITGSDWILVNVTAADDYRDSVVLEWQGANESFDTNASDSFWENKSGLSEGTYSLRAFVNDSAGHLNQTLMRYVTVDLSAPAWSSLNQTVGGSYDTVFHRGDTVTLSANWTDAGSLDAAWLATNESGTWQNKTGVYGSPNGFSGTSNLSSFSWTNDTLAVGSSVGWRIYANDSLGRVNQTDVMSFMLWGYSEVSAININPSKIVPGGNTLILCRVRDNTTLSGIGGYDVSFYNSTNILGTNTTNGTGWAIYSYSHPDEGSEQITCNITSDASLYYNASAANSQYTFLVVEVGGEDNGCEDITYAGGGLSGSCSSVASSDGDHLNWTEVLDAASDGTYYVEIGASSDQPAEVVNYVNYTWEVSRVVLNFAGGYQAPTTGSMTFIGGSDLNVTFNASDGASLNCTEVTAGGSKKRFIDGRLNFYVPEYDTEATYSRLDFIMVAEQAVDTASSDTLVFDAYNFGAGSFDTTLFTIYDYETSYTTYTYSITSGAENYIDTTGLVQIRMQDTHNVNGESTSNWLIDRILVVAYYDNPSTGSVYNYSLGYVNQSSGQRVRIGSEAFTSADTSFYASVTSGLTDAISFDGNMTAYITFREEGASTQDTERRSTFSIDYFNAYVNYDSTSALNLTVTIVDDADEAVSGATVSVYNQSAFKISSQTLGGSQTELLDILVLSRGYDVEESIPTSSGVLTAFIRNLNLTETLSLKSQVIDYYGGDKPENISNLTVLYALNDTGLSFTLTELVIPKGSVDVNAIVHCLDWDYATADCSNWEVNDTDDYSMQENSSHIWFNVTSFDTFGGGSGDTLPNLTEIRVYEVTGLSDTHNGGTLLHSGLNTTFNLTTGGVYLVDFHVTNDGRPWTFDAADIAYHQGLNSSWQVNASADVWYTDSAGATNYTGGTWSSGNVSWNLSLGGSLKTGGEAVFSYVVNLSGAATQSLQVYFLINDTSKSSGSFDYSTFDVSGSWLEPYMVLPPTIPGDGDAENNTGFMVGVNRKFMLNATVTCREGDCGNVYGTVRYNASTADPDTQMSATPTSPLYVLSGGSPQACPNNPLELNESCNLSWTINSTGSLGSLYLLDVLFNSTQTPQNDTNNTLIHITKVLILNISWDEIAFGVVNPGSYGNPAQQNDALGYNITLDVNSNDADGLYIKGSDLAAQTITQLDGIPYGIGVGNISWNDNENNYSAGTTERLSTTYSLMRASVLSGTVIPTYYWVDAPTGQHTQEFRGNLTIMANSTS